MSKKNISAVINTYNEESNIDKCIRSLLWCDQILIVDMMSEDRTIEIASKYDVDIIRIEKIREFDRARKIAIDNAKYDWILLVDADEIIPPKLSLKIIERINHESYNAYKLPRLNYIFGVPSTGNGLWPDYQLRLFMKDSVEVTGEVHNFLHLKLDSTFDLFEKNKETSIHHFTYNNLEEYISKINLYTSLQAENNENKLKSPLFSFVKEFLFRFLRLRGFKDGKKGFRYAFLLAFYKYIYYTKVMLSVKPIDTDEIKESLLK